MRSVMIDRQFFIEPVSTEFSIVSASPQMGPWDDDIRDFKISEQLMF